MVLSPSGCPRSPLPPIRPYGQQAAPLPDILAERIARRLRVVEQHTGMRFPLPKGWHEPLYWSAAREAILHMDFRPANVLSRSGAIAAVIDWSNMLFGPPALELARIAEYGLLDEEFLEGYGSPDRFGHLPPGLEALYRLDTAVMLSVVFLSERTIGSFMGSHPHPHRGQSGHWPDSRGHRSGTPDLEAVAAVRR